MPEIIVDGCYCDLCNTERNRIRRDIPIFPSTFEETVTNPIEQRRDERGRFTSAPQASATIEGSLINSNTIETGDVDDIKLVVHFGELTFMVTGFVNTIELANPLAMRWSRLAAWIAEYPQRSAAGWLQVRLCEWYMGHYRVVRRSTWWRNSRKGRRRNHNQMDQRQPGV